MSEKNCGNCAKENDCAIKRLNGRCTYYQHWQPKAPEVVGVGAAMSEAEKAASRAGMEFLKEQAERIDAQKTHAALVQENEKLKLQWERLKNWYRAIEATHKGREGRIPDILAVMEDLEKRKP